MSFVGRSLDRLSIPERKQLAGKWAAFEIYTPATTPLKVIAALGASPGEVLRQLAAQGLDPRQFEVQLLSASY